MIRSVLCASVLLASLVLADQALGQASRRPLQTGSDDTQILDLAEQVLRVDRQMVADVGDFVVGPIEIPEFDVVTVLDSQELPELGELAMRAATATLHGAATARPPKGQATVAGASSVVFPPEFSELDLVVPSAGAKPAADSRPSVESAVPMKSTPAATMVALQLESESWDSQPSPPTITIPKASPAGPAEQEPARKETPDRAGTSKKPLAADADVATQDETPSPESLDVARRQAVKRLSPSMTALGDRIQRCLRFYYNRPLNTQDDSAWSIMHSFLGYGVETPLAVGGPTGRRTNAIGWLCWNNPCAGRQLFYLDNGHVRGREGPGFQGHPGQFLAIVSQIKLKSDYPMRIDGKLYSIEDLIEEEKRTCAPNVELTFKLIALSHYLDSEEVWQNQYGHPWSIPKLIEIEMSQPVNGAACGGTHRIMGCTYAVYRRERQGQPVTGQWARAKNYVRNYQRYAFSLQNRDGSFSSDWFKRRADWGDTDRKLQTTGHILEWLVFSLPEEELQDPRVVRSVNFLTNLMINNRYHDWEVGPRGHALRALSLYQERLFGSDSTELPVAQRNRQRARK